MDGSHSQTEYHLRLSIGQVVGMVGVVVVGIAGTAFLALTNRKAVSLFGMVTLTSEQAVWLFWGFAGFLGLTALPLALATTWKGRFADQRIEFTELGVWLPRSVWSSKHVLVPFTEIHGVRILARQRQRLLEIDLPGRKFWVGERWLPSAEIFDKLVSHFLAELNRVPSSLTSPFDRPSSAS
jgi:hypothetical protein